MTGETIVFGGVEVDLDAVEAALVADHDVAAAAAVGVNDAFLGNSLHVFVHLEEGRGESYDLRKRLLNVVSAAGHPRPRALRFVDALPTSGGRVDRTAVADVANGRSDSVSVEQLDDPSSLLAIANAR